MPPSAEAGRLAKRLRGLRDSPDVTLTQSQLAKAFSHDSRVAIATISSWESKTNPKLPPAERLRSYALLFSTDRTNPDGTPKMVSERELTADERERFDELHEELLGLRDAVRLQSSGTSSSVGGNFTWDFENGPITIICPEAPIGERLDLADEKDPNYTRMYRYADLDALMELWGHLRASNPELQVYHRLPSEVKADDMSSHLVLLGGIGWNHVTRRLLKTLREMPISQFEVSDLKTGEIFKASGAGGKEFRPVFEEGEDGPELTEDVALLTRLRNPFNNDRTLTICNGVHSRGVLGAVRALTDIAVRERNEAYLSEHFPDGLFAMLLRVPVVNGEAITPDLEIPANRLYQWEPDHKVKKE